MELTKPIIFEWDKENTNKNFSKHKVTNEETEQVFQDSLKLIVNDSLHSREENRFIVLGHTFNYRILSIAFTLRNNSVRVISARDASRKERKWYEEKVNTA